MLLLTGHGDWRLHCRSVNSKMLLNPLKCPSYNSLLTHSQFCGATYQWNISFAQLNNLAKIIIQRCFVTFFFLQFAHISLPNSYVVRFDKNKETSAPNAMRWNNERIACKWHNFPLPSLRFAGALVLGVLEQLYIPTLAHSAILNRSVDSVKPTITTCNVVFIDSLYRIYGLFNYSDIS